MTSRATSKPPVDAPADPLSPFLGPLLLRAREAAGMKQEVVANKAKISDTTLRKIENGLGPLRNDHFHAICKALVLNPDLILLEALTALWLSLIEKLGRDSLSPLPFLREKIFAAVEARHQAERKELDARLVWDNFLYFKMQFPQPE